MKGLIEAVKNVMPYAEHRQCARHIYEGFRKQFTGLEFRELFWAASKASYPPRFNKIMDKIKKANPKAHKFLMDKNPKTWSRAFFEVGRGCEAVENGFSECFNSVILSVRDKPLLTMLESMRVIVLERMHRMREISKKWTPGVCPNIQKRLEWMKDQQRYVSCSTYCKFIVTMVIFPLTTMLYCRFWHVIPAGGNVFEVRSGSQAYTVDEPKNTCTCRMWQLSGIPCVHATKLILYINKMPESYVPAWFKTEMYHVTYSSYMKPVDGIDFWPDQSMYSLILPPKPKKMPGRPRKKRIRSRVEGGSSTRVSKVGVVMSCSICHQPGHNKKSCKNEPVQEVPKEKKPRGRPRKRKLNEGENVIVENEPTETTVIVENLGGSTVGGSNTRADARSGGKRNIVGRISSSRRGGAKSGSNNKSSGSGRKSLKRSCTSAYARWFGDPETDTADASERVNPEDQNGEPKTHEHVENEGQIEIELTGTQTEIMHVDESQTQNDDFEVQEPEEDDFEVQQQQIPQAPVVQARFRRPSERIMKNKLATKIHGQGSTPEAALVVDDA